MLVKLESVAIWVAELPLIYNQYIVKMSTCGEFSHMLLQVLNKLSQDYFSLS